MYYTYITLGGLLNEAIISPKHFKKIMMDFDAQIELVTFTVGIAMQTTGTEIGTDLIFLTKNQLN